MVQIKGHHHISMMTKDAKENNHFYQMVLGLRRVKMTVNQDDPSMYHLFYGDLTGSPGTELTFFAMPQIGRTYEGTNMINRIGLVVSSVKSLTFWKKRFEQFGVIHGEITTYANRSALHFEDKDGLQLVLQVSDETPPLWEPWGKSTVPEEHQIKGMGTVEMNVRRIEKLKRTLTELFHYSMIEEQQDELILQSIKGEIFGEILVKQLDGKPEKPGRGSIHHLAIRAKDDDELAYWEEQVKQRGFHSTGIIDRYYFKSFYFRESNGILFEIATDGPGFLIDSSLDSLGENLDLPSFLKDQRQEIEAKLLPIEEMS